MKKESKFKCYFTNNINILKYIVVLGCLLSIIIFTYFYVRNESPIYIFDYSGYFENFKLMGNLMFTSFSEFWNLLITSIRNYDYNYSSVVLLMPFYKILGTSRFSYILSLTVMYIFPSILLITYGWMNVIKNDMNKKEKVFYFIFTMIVTFMYTRLWSPTLRGLSDIIGLIPIIISYIIVMKKPLVEKQNFLRVMLLGLVVYLPFLFRRWYIYYIIGFCISCFLLDFYYFLTKSRNKETFFIAFKNYFLLGITILGFTLVCQFPLLKEILSQNYSDAYNGFQASFMGHLTGFYNEFGLIIILLSLCGIVLTFVRKKYYKTTVFSVLNILIFWISFGMVQNMGVHHYLGISFWVILLVFVGIRHIYELLPKGKIVFLGVILCFFAINFMTTFIFRDTHVPLISQNNKYYKFRYNNFDELTRLITDIEVLMKDPVDKQVSNAKFSVLGDTGVISDNLIDLLGNVDIKDNIVYATHVDSRDGINFNSLLMQYIVVTNESQLGTNPIGQYVIDIPNQMIYRNEGIGKAYKRIAGPYLLDDGVEAYIYEKERKFTTEEVDEYFESFYEYYPDWKEKYDLFDKLILASDLYLGSNLGAFKRMDEDTYFFFPGITDTNINICLEKQLKTLKLKFYVDYKGDNEDSGKVNVIIKSGKEKLYSEEVTYHSEIYAELDLSEVNDLILEINGGDSLQDDWLMMDIVEYQFTE